MTGASPTSATVDLPSDLALLALLRTFIGACGTAWGIDDERVEDSKLAVSELLAFTNGPRVRVTFELDGRGSTWIRSSGVRPPTGEDDLRLRLLDALASEVQWDEDAVSICLPAENPTTE